MNKSNGRDGWITGTSLPYLSAKIHIRKIWHFVIEKRKAKVFIYENYYVRCPGSG